MKEAPWIFAYASVIGNSHKPDNIPCQDHCKVENFKNFSIAIVCDGAGSCANSQIGAQHVVEFAVYHFKNLVHANKWHRAKKLPIIKQWHDKAKKALFSIREDLENFALSNDIEFKSLSCTIIVTIAFKHGLLVTHIGDGRAGFCDLNNKWTAMITPFRGEEANETIFLTSEIWDESEIDSYIKSNVIENEVKAFCLLSDGCEKASFECNLFDEVSNKYYDPNRPYQLFFDPNVVILNQMYSEGRAQDEINNLWSAFLADGNEKLRQEPDDKTMILGVRLGKT